MPHHPVRIPLAAVIASLVWLGAARPGFAEWRRIDTPNFTVIGDVHARTLRDVALKFEGFRETLSRLLTQRATSTAVPTIVIVFPSDRAFTPFKTLYQGKPVAISGLFVGRQDANYIAVVADGRPDAMRVVFHEYAHLIVSNLWRNAPAWVNEGVAEFYSTYEVSTDGREAVIGRPILDHVRELTESQQLKLGDLLTVDQESPLYNERNRRSVFYAQSWALTHLLVLGKPGRTKELFTYLDFVTQGVEPGQAWTRAFATVDMDRELKKYVRDGTFISLRYKFTDKLAQFDGVPQTLPSGDAEAFLAEFLMQQQRYDEALARLDAAEKLGPGHPRLEVMRALVEIAKGNDEAGAQRLVATPVGDDWLLAYTAAVGLVDLVERRHDTPTDEQLKAVRALFETVRKHAEIPNVNARLASMELRSAAGPSSRTRMTIERARLMVPGREDYAFLHAQILAQQREYGLARNIVGPLMSGVYPADVREAARDLMRTIGEQEAREQQRAAHADTSPAESSSDAATIPAGNLRPIFRELKDGEQRLEGALERIECRARGAAVFHIRTTAGLEAVTSRKMTDVEFLTYRDDLTGSVACGPLKPPLSVLVTWRPDPTATGARTVVAIEFPPK
jgi:uncharacterized protein DUF1570